MTEPVVYTTFDKEKRNELWRELRTRGRGTERQVVRFSGVTSVLGPDGKQLINHANHAVGSPCSAHCHLVWQSSWSVSHPAEIETLKGKN